jgi:mannose-6-phosphate isomerase-like protein (cupin superfamily)
MQRTVPRTYNDHARMPGKEITMVKMGGMIENPLIGHEFRFFGHRLCVLESTRETGGVLGVDYSAPPLARVPEHVHHDQEERLEVVSGTLCLRVGGRELTLGPGQSAVGPSKVPHEWRNPSADEEVRFLVGIRPGLPVESMLEKLLGLMRDGKTIGSIPRNPLQLAVLAREVARWAYPTGIPMPVRKALFAPVTLLAFVGRLLGYRAFYPDFRHPRNPR